jgi:plastocyanin
VLLCGPQAVEAQTTCRTANCKLSTAKPPECLNRARPRKLTVRMQDALVFLPSEPRIEPGECIDWTPQSNLSHDSSHNSCTDSAACNTPPVIGCRWDTGNSAGTNPTIVCHYDATTWPGGNGDMFYCRNHASPVAGTMRGTLRVTTPIAVLAAKDTGTSELVLSWTGGGIPGSEIFKVVRAGEKTFNILQTFDPAGGMTGRTYREALGTFPASGIHYYIIRNRQQNDT